MELAVGGLRSRGSRTFLQFTEARTEVIMIKIHRSPGSPVPLALVSCRVRRVDAYNAVCMVHNPQCVWATPYGNYCEHAQVDRIAECDSGEHPEDSGDSSMH